MNFAVGLDEAGRGPVIGPLVIGICAVPEDELHVLKDWGVNDSKVLSKSKRIFIEKAFNTKLQSSNWFGATISLTPERIDFALQNRGLNALEVEGFREAIHLLPLQQNMKIIADACDVNPSRFQHNISQGIKDWPWHNSSLLCEHKADSHHLIVAMASILAKQERDREIQRLEEQLGFPIGSGYPSDSVTINALERLCGQKQIHQEVRWSWATIQRFWRQHRRGEPPIRGRQRHFQQRLFEDEDPRSS